MGNWAHTIIAGKKEQGVLIEPSLFEGITNLPDHPVHLHQEISVGSESALACKLFHWCPGLMGDGRGIVQKERFIRFLLGMIFYDLYCPFRNLELACSTEKPGAVLVFTVILSPLILDLGKVMKSVGSLVKRLFSIQHMGSDPAEEWIPKKVSNPRSTGPPGRVGLSTCFSSD